MQLSTPLVDLATAMRRIGQHTIKPHFGNVAAADISIKDGNDDYVTKWDRQAELELSMDIARIFPQALIIAEEAVSAGQVSLDEIQLYDGLVTVIDPLDGTTNFKKGVAEYGIFCNFIENKQPCIGMAYDIPHDVLYVVQKDAGVAAFRNGLFSAGEQILPFNQRQTITPLTQTGAISTHYHQNRLSLLTLAQETLNARENWCSLVEAVKMIEGKSPWVANAGAKLWDILFIYQVTEALGGDIWSPCGDALKSFDPSDRLLVFTQSVAITSQIKAQGFNAIFDAGYPNKSAI